MKFEKSCGAIVFHENERREKRFLIIHMNQGHYSFPKGHVESMEDEYTTAHREVLEETGIRMSIIEGFRYVETYSPFKGVMKDVVFFLGKAKNINITPQLEEIQSASFVSKEKVKALLTYSQDQEVFCSALDFIEEHHL